MPDIPSDKIAVRCSCGTKLAVPASAVGKNAKCPKCEKVFPIAAPAKAAPAAPSPALRPATAPKVARPAPTTPRPAPAKPRQVVEELEEDSLLSALAAQEKTAEATSPPPESRLQVPCPKCKTMIPADSRICVACGYNMETGRSVKVARTQPVAAVKAAKFAGRLSLGVALSGVGALVGAGIWFGVAVATHLEIGWIAWGVGVLAGLGMRLGYGKESGFAGLAASGMAIVGILVAKVLIFVGFLAAAAEEFGGIETIEREMVRDALVTEAREQAAASSNGEAGAATADAEAAAEERVGQMSDEEIQRKLAEYHQSHPVSDEEAKEAASNVMATFFSLCFHPIDGLFLLLALGSAYKLASGGGGE